MRMTNTNRFAENLKYLREKKGISQAELARRIGASNGIVSLWESKQREPVMHSLLALADYFGVTLEELVDYNK